MQAARYRRADWNTGPDGARAISPQACTKKPLNAASLCGALADSVFTRCLQVRGFQVQRWTRQALHAPAGSR